MTTGRQPSRGPSSSRAGIGPAGDLPRVGRNLRLTAESIGTVKPKALHNAAGLALALPAHTVGQAFLPVVCGINTRRTDARRTDKNVCPTAAHRTPWDRHSCLSFAGSTPDGQTLGGQTRMSVLLRPTGHRGTGIPACRLRAGHPTDRHSTDRQECLSYCGPAGHRRTGIPACRLRDGHPTDRRSTDRQECLSYCGPPDAVGQAFLPVVCEMDTRRTDAQRTDKNVCPTAVRPTP
jgi:hypothetical protein